MNADWPYYTLKNGRLFDEQGDELKTAPDFTTTDEAEGWLVEHDERGSVRSIGIKERESGKTMNEISAGTIVTECLYSDRNVYDVIARTEKSLTLRERKPILDKKPVMQTGGFCAVVIENAVWHTEPDTTGMITKAWMRKDGKFHTGMGIVVIGDNYFYDCAF